MEIILSNCLIVFLITFFFLTPKKNKRLTLKQKQPEAKLKQKKGKQKKLKKKSKQTYLTNFLINIKTLALNIEKIDGLWIMNQGLFL